MPAAPTVPFMSTSITFEPIKEAESNPVKSPCIAVCTVDGLSGYCLGCYRTLGEIAGWLKLTNDERAAIIAAKDSRLAEAQQKRADFKAKK